MSAAAHPLFGDLPGVTFAEITPGESVPRPGTRGVDSEGTVGLWAVEPHSLPPTFAELRIQQATEAAATGRRPFDREVIR